MKLKSIYLLIAAAGLITIGCGTPKGYVAKQWSVSMRELGIIPVFPPREDVQVGDIYISPLPPESEIATLAHRDFIPLGTWLATLSVEPDLTDFYSKRASFPITTSATAEFMTNQLAAPFAILPESRDTNRNIFQGGDINRLRMVGFPSFMSATFYKGDLSAVVPVEAVNLAFAGGFTASKSVTVSVPVAESYGLPAEVMWNKLMTADGKLIDLPKISWSQLNRLVSPAQCSFDGTNYFVPVRVITEVYYARALDISIASKKTGGFGVAGRPLATPAVGTGVASVISANIPAGVTNGSANAIERASQLNDSLTQSMSQNVPGGSVKFVAAGDWGVSMRRTYEHPIAIGYRALQLNIPLSGPPNGGGSAQGFVPTSTGAITLSVESVPGIASTNSTPVNGGAVDIGGHH